MTVIAAFPATGKTHVAGRDHRFVDSDSSSFSWASPGVRSPEWPSNYIAHIHDGVRAGAKVLVSTHAEVRDALRHAQVPFTLVYPTLGQRGEYIDRIRRRGSPESMVQFIWTNWDRLIESCEQQEGATHVQLRPGQFLADVLPRVTPTPTEKQA